jgi:hypothetical protein
MRYRILSPLGDYTIGQGQAEFLVNSPECVAQAVQTRLLLLQGEWFLDTTDGTPYATQILGEGTMQLYDQAIQERISQTQGIMAITNYSSSFDSSRRSLSVSVTIDTIYGTTTTSISI